VAGISSCVSSIKEDERALASAEYERRAETQGAGMRLLLRFLGRCLFAFLFISSGLSKLQGFYDNSSKLVSMLQPRITQAIEKTMMTLHLDLDKPEVTPAIATYALYAILFLELVGGVSFMFFPRAGSGLLSLYLVLVTPVMHDFYNHRPGSPAYTAEMVHFLKNVALLGATFFVMGERKTQTKKKIKSQ